jgi:RNA polymerase sigma-70 factor, ECF subfamily
MEVIIIKELVKKAQSGDRQAFIKLIEEYQDDIYRTALIYTKNQDDALDIVQETAFRSFSKIKSLKSPQFLKTWLMKITINAAIDLLRDKKKVIHLKPEYTEYIGTEDGDIPLSITLKEVINKLDEREKCIILLKYYFNHTFKEISEIMDIPLGTIKSTLYRALQKMRLEMKEGDICGK